MISFLDGRLDEKQPTRAVLDVGGVGYELLIPLSSYDRLPREGERCRLFTWLHVREDALTLYGFASETERRMFGLLISISGIGPKTALGALGGLAPRDLAAAVVGGDIKRLTSISGIGRKTAERIVMELRDKLSHADALEAIAGAGEISASDQHRRDAILALIALGYKQLDAQKMITALPSDVVDGSTVEDLIRNALSGR